MSILHPIRSRRSNEELFFELYSQILGWASQLVHSDRADAEDLVQEFYIHVTRSNVALADVDEIQPYLFKVLRNLHYSRLRQEGRSPIYDLSIVDYDSVEWGLAAVDRRGLFLVRANLKTVCEFVCQRKNTSRAASVFILRFFMGYFPSEVMKVAQLTRVGVDKSLQFARREAQLYLDKPGATRSVVPQGPPSTLSSTALDESHALFLELGQSVFSSCGGACFAPSALEKRYRGSSPARFTTQELAHLVSCKTCLDRANRILGLPLLDERSLDDTIGRNNPPGPGEADGPKLSVNRGAKRAAGPKERKALNRKARGVFEHRPESLEVSVNGETRTSQRVTAEVSEFHLKLNRAEEAEFIEVFSEQRVRLAYLHVAEPTLYPGLEQCERVVLSDGRSLDLILSFANDLPTVRVVYRDPVFAQSFILDEEIENIVVMGANKEPIEAGCAPESERVVRFPLLGWSSHKMQKLFEVISRHMNPLFASAMILGLASVLCFIFWMQSGPRITAGAFLDRAQMQEARVGVNAPPGVIYQKICIKTPARTSERTLYRDVQHRWRVRERELNAADFRLRERLKTAGVDWNDPLSAGTYRDWYNHEARKTDAVARTGGGLLTLTTTVNDATVVSQSLTVRESDFHAVGRTIKFRDYGTVEIAELNYDVLPWSAVNPDWFEPLAAVSSNLPGLHASLLPRLPARLSDMQLDQAELEARVVLNHLHADTSGRLEITRGASGIQVKGIVEDDARKQEIVRELRQIPHVVPAVFTFEEMERQPAKAGDEVTSVEQSSVDAAPSPLEKYLVGKGESKEDVSQAYQQFFSDSVAVNQNSKAITDLLRRFASGEQLTEAARTALKELIVQDKANLNAALQRQQLLVQQLGIVASPPSTDPSQPSAVEALSKSSARNVALSNELITSSNAQPRSAEAILAELAESIAQTRSAVSSMLDEPTDSRAPIAGWPPAKQTTIGSQR